MIVLALETATRHGSVALARDGRLLAERRGDAARPHATRLPGDWLSLLDETGLTLEDVGLLAVCVGPGAFTGLRVGIAAMQGLSFATALPIVGVSALDALAAAALAASADAAAQLPHSRAAELQPRPGSTGPVAGVWMDAARQEVFAARYRREPAAVTGIAALDEPVSAPAAAVARAWRDAPPDIWIGEGVERYRDDALPLGGYWMTPVPAIAPLVAELGARLASAGLAGPPHALRPVYVRRSDAELARDRRQAQPGRC